MSFFRRFVILSILFSCEHYPSNVEVVYKNTSGAGYKSSGSSLSDVEAEDVKTHKTPEKMQPLSPIKNTNSPEVKNNSASVSSSASVSIAKPNKRDDDTYHVVQHGETFYSIARLHKLNPNDLMKWNGYNQTQILKPSTIIKLTQEQNENKPKVVENLAKSNTNQEKPLTIIKSQGSSPEVGVSSCGTKFINPILENAVLVKFGDVYGGGVKSDGIIFKTKKEEVVRASNNGEVAYVGDGFSDYGNLIIIRHINNYFSIYGHLKDVRVKKGQLVIKCDILASTSIK